MNVLESFRDKATHDLPLPLLFYCPVEARQYVDDRLQLVDFLARHWRRGLDATRLRVLLRDA